MKVLNKEKDSIMVSLDPPPINENCVPEKYHLEYSASGREPWETQEFNPEVVEVRQGCVRKSTHSSELS